MPEVAGADPCAALEKALADAQAELARDVAAKAAAARFWQQLDDELRALGDGAVGWLPPEPSPDDPTGGPLRDLFARRREAGIRRDEFELVLDDDRDRVAYRERMLAACRAKKSVEPETHVTVTEAIIYPLIAEPETQIMIGAPPPFFPTKVESVVDDLGDQAGRPLTTKGRSDQQKRAAVAVGAVILVLLLGVGGYAVTRSTPAATPLAAVTPSVTPSTQIAPVQGLPVAVLTRVDYRANGPAVSLFYLWTPHGVGNISAPSALKTGDIAVINFTGPGLPATLSLPVGADGTFSQTFTIAPGRCVWTSKVVSIGGRPIVSSPSILEGGTSSQTGLVGDACP